MSGDASVTMPLAALDCVIQAIGLGTGPLFSRIRLPKTDDIERREAETWWQKLSAPNQETVSSMVNQLGDPSRVADTFVIMEDVFPLCTQVVLTKKETNQTYLVGKDEAESTLRIVPVDQPEEWLNTLLSYLDALSPLDQTQMRFKLPLDDFLVWLAVVDTDRYMRASALVKSEPTPDVLTVDGIVTRLTHELQNLDIRWLVSSFQLALPTKVGPGPAEPIRASIDRLITAGLLVRANGGMTLSEAGQFLARSWNRRTAQVVVSSVSSQPNGGMVFGSNMWIRGERSIWVVDVTGSPEGAAEALVTTVDADLARKSLEAVFQTVGVAQQNAPPKAGTMGFCSQCGTALPAGSTFCQYCGTKVTN